MRVRLGVVVIADDTITVHSSGNRLFEAGNVKEREGTIAVQKTMLAVDVVR